MSYLLFAGTVYQLISTLADIQAKFPSYRHNDFKANNILLVNDKLKVTDYDFTCIPKIIENSKVNKDWCSIHNIKPMENKYYDLHYFLNSLISIFIKDLMDTLKKNCN